MSSENAQIVFVIDSDKREFRCQEFAILFFQVRHFREFLFTRLKNCANQEEASPPMQNIFA